MLAGFVVVAILSNLPNDVARLFGGHLYEPPPWLPIIEFPWRIAFGTVVTFSGIALNASATLAFGVATLNRG